MCVCVCVFACVCVCLYISYTYFVGGAVCSGGFSVQTIFATRCFH